MNAFERMPYRLTATALLAGALYATGACAHAGEDDASMFSFSGFGTVGLVHSSEDQADFTSNYFKPNGAGYSHGWSADVDSLIGGQVTANFTPRLSAILQIIAEQNYDNSYRPHMEWANIKYQFTPDISIRAGRIVLPAFLVSDYRKVGYINPWVRPPVDVYRLMPVSNSDGIDASYRVRVGELINTVWGSYGKSESRHPAGGAVKARSIWGIFNTAEYGPLTAHIAYLKADVTVESVNALFDAYRLFGPEGIAIADKYDAANKPFSFLTLGASYDPGSWFIMGEWGSVESHSVLGKVTAWYASAGYRLGNVTPYVTYAQMDPDNLSDPGLAAPGAAGLNSALNSLLSSKPSQRTISVGGRWDFKKNAALKLQYDHTRIDAGSAGILTNTQPGFQLGGEVNVISATIDFVF